MIALGAVIPGGTYGSCGRDSDPPYWIGCLTRGEGGEPHCYFIKHALDLVLHCPACRPHRNRVDVERKRFVGPAWGKGKPFWETARAGKDLTAWRAVMAEEFAERAAIREYLGNVSRERSTRRTRGSGCAP